MAYLRWGFLACLLTFAMPAFAGYCDLSSVVLVNQTQIPLSWNAGIDVGTVDSVTSDHPSTQPIAPGHQVKITLHDDQKGIKGYFNIYDDNDNLVAVLNVHYSNHDKACKIDKSYEDIKDNYKITSATPKASKDKSQAQPTLSSNNTNNNSTTFYINHG